MEVSMSRMGEILIFSVLFGAVFGLLYDALRILRLMRRCSSMRVWRFVGGVEDTLFITFFSLCFSVFVYYTNDGVFRVFMLIGVFCGFFGYYFTVGRIVIRASEKIIRAIRRFLSFLLSIILKPLRRLARFIHKKAVHPLFSLMRGFGYFMYDLFFIKTALYRERRRIFLTLRLAEVQMENKR